MKIRQYLPRREIAQTMGGLYSQTMRTLAYWNIINSFVLIVLGWNSSMGNVLRAWFPWMTLPLFLLACLLGFLVVSFVDLMFILPSIIAFNNRQGIKHDNPVFVMMGEMKSDIKDIKAKLGIP